MRLLPVSLALLVAVSSIAQEPPAPINPAPDRRPGEGQGPFKRMVIRGITMIDGTGAPPRGPMDIVVESNRIREIKSVGAPRTAIEGKGRPAKGEKEIDGTGLYALPGFVDLHVHTGGAPKAPDAEYAHKLWMGHGVTAVRGVPAGTMDWSLKVSQDAPSASAASSTPSKTVSFMTRGSSWRTWRPWWKGQRRRLAPATKSS